VATSPSWRRDRPPNDGAFLLPVRFGDWPHSGMNLRRRPID